MLSAKRDQIRQRLRSSELSNMFAIKRRQLMKGQTVVLHELSQQIQLKKYDLNYEKTVAKIIQYSKIHPEDQNGYILIGNMMIDHPDSFNAFFEYLTSTEKYMQTYMWCIYTMTWLLANSKSQITHERRQISQLTNTQYDYQIVRIQAPQRKQKIFLLLNIAVNMAKTLEDHLNRLQLIEAKRQQSIWQFFIGILNISIGSFQEQLPEQAIAVFVSITKRLIKFKPSPQDNTTDYLMIWKCLCHILKQHLHLAQQSSFQIVRQAVYIFPEIVSIVLSYLPDHRLECLNFFAEISIVLRIEFRFFQPLYEQLTTLYQQYSNLRPSIALIFSHDFINIVSLDQLVRLINMGMHFMMMQHIETSIEQYENQRVASTLGSLCQLLERLVQEHQKSILNHLLSDMQNKGFEVTLQELSEKKQQQDIELFLNRIMAICYLEDQEIM